MAKEFFTVMPDTNCLLSMRETNHTIPYWALWLFFLHKGDPKTRLKNSKIWNIKQTQVRSFSAHRRPFKDKMSFQVYYRNRHVKPDSGWKVTCFLFYVSLYVVTERVVLLRGDGQVLAYYGDTRYELFLKRVYSIICETKKKELKEIRN